MKHSITHIFLSYVAHKLDIVIVTVRRENIPYDNNRSYRIGMDSASIERIQDIGKLAKSESCLPAVYPTILYIF